MLLPRAHRCRAAVHGQTTVHCIATQGGYAHTGLAHSAAAGALLLLTCTQELGKEERTHGIRWFRGEPMTKK